MNDVRNKIRETIIAAGFFLLLPIVFHTHVFQSRLNVDERYTVYLPDRYVSAQSWRGGEIPLWNPYVQCGVPHLALHHVGALYPPNIIAYALVSPTLAFNLLQWVHYSFAGFMTFLLARRLGCGFGGGLWAGIVFMFCGFMMAHATHTPMQQSAAWLPLIFYLLVRLRERGAVGAIVLAALTFALQILAGYMQVWVMTVLAALLYAVYDAVAERRVRFLLQVLAAVALGLALSSAQILATSEAVRETVRQRLTYEEFVQYSVPRYLLPTLLFPYLFGTNFPNLYPIKYFGPWHLHEMIGYVGTAPIVLAVLAFVIARRGRNRPWFWLILAVVALVFAMGDDTPLYRLMYHVPGYNLFRVPARHWLLFGLAVAVLSGIGLSALIQERNERSPTLRHHPRLAAGILTAGAVVSLILLYGFGKTLNIAGIDTAMLDTLRQNFRLSNPAIWIPLTLMVLGAASFAFAGAAKSRWFFVPLFVVLLLEFSALRHSLFIGAQKTEVLFEDQKRNSVYAWLSQQQEHSYDYRIFPVMKEVGEGVPELLYPCVNQCYEVQSMIGYGPFLPKVYSQVLGMYTTGIARDVTDLLGENRVISALNVKYLLVLDDERHRDIMRMIESARRTEKGEQDAPLYELRTTSRRGHVRVYENRAAQERAFFAPAVSAVSDAGEIMKRIQSNSEPRPSHTPILLQAPRSTLEHLETLTTGTAVIRSYSNNRVRIETHIAQPGVLVLADSFYRGWNAYIDGTRTGVFRASAILRAVIVPPGTHTVLFTYEPAEFRIGLFISLLMIAVLCSLALLGAAHSRKHAPVILSETKNLKPKNLEGPSSER